MNAFDHYEAARSIAERLRRKGELDSAATLEDTIRFGSTATEILMGLQWHLTKLLDSDTAADSGIDEAICELLVELDRSLGTHKSSDGSA